MAKFSELMHHPWLSPLRRRLTTGDAAYPSSATVADSDRRTTADLVEASCINTQLPPAQAFSIAQATDPTLSTDVANANDSSQDAPSALGWAPQTTPPPRGGLARPAQVGLLGLAIVALWWTWPRSGAPDFTLAAAWNNRNPAPETVALAVVNPANAARATAAAGSGIMATLQSVQATVTPFFPSIIVVTPTAAGTVTQPNTAPDVTTEDSADRSAAPVIILEASTLITGETPALIEVELPNAGVANAALLQPAAQPEAVVVALLPTATPSPTTEPQILPLATVPRVEVLPAAGADATATPVPPSPTPTTIPSPTPPAVGPGRLWSTFTPKPVAQSDHFWVANPFAGFASNRFASPNYQFGSTAGNRYRPHHGLDISNPLGTPVQAGVEGVVVHAGLDDPDVLGPYPNFYGQAVVILLDRRLPVAGGELDVFLLHGHLSEVRVTVGQRVQPSDIVGLVGMTGIAIGPHLHIEVRLGANTYSHSVNPWLWLEPAPGNGAVAVRVLTADGRTWAGAKVSIARFQRGQAIWARQIETYLDTENIGPDPAWGENGAMGDVPAGTYYLIANIDGESIRAEFDVRAGETTFVEIRTNR